LNKHPKVQLPLHRILEDTTHKQIQEKESESEA
jgi:hypothetical protein